MYDTIQIAPPADLDKTKINKNPAGMAMVHAIDEIQDSIFDPETFPKRLDNQELDGQTWTLFQFEYAKLGQEMAVKVWIDAVTGCMHRMESKFHLSMYIDGIIQTQYDNAEKNHCFPKQIDVKIDIIIPLNNAKMNLKQSPRNWILRPV